ncbi:MAG: UvrD-helicase domain-containing protein [Elusimicrobia bacterium]|nr:UvrD-helicase domain-containing protein [Elusimicrobiota bacterium]
MSTRRSPRVLTDEESRWAARTHLDGNAVVEAGAGTGKTTLLVDRLIFLLLGRRCQISRAVALTFTEKAAGELKRRLAQTLEAIVRWAGQTNGVCDPHLLQIVQRLQSQWRRSKQEIEVSAQRALLEMDRASIGTLHSFAADLLRLYPLESGISPEFQVDEGRSFEEFFRSQWSLWLDRELGEEAPRKGLWKKLLPEVGLEDLACLARDLCQLRSLEGVASLEKIREAFEVVGPFVERFRRELLHKDWLSFDGLLVRARELLVGHRTVREDLKRTFEAILIDEFQDTDPLQGEILFFLCEKRGQSARCWEEVNLEPGKLFVVGDPKQSIYHFRGADIVAYRRFTRQMIRQGSELLHLQVNFRSPAGILDPVHEIFSKIMDGRSPYQADYIPIYPHKNSEPVGPDYGRGVPAPHAFGTRPVEGSGVEWVQVSSSNQAAPVSAEATRQAEAAWIAEWISSHCSKKILFRDVAILFRTSTPHPPYLEALRGAGIPYVVTGEKYFYSAQEVVDFQNLLCALEDPYDPVSLVGLLRSPLVGLTDLQLYELSQKGALCYLSDPPKNLSCSARTAAFYRMLRSFHALVGRMPLSELVHRLLNDTHLVELCSLAYHREQTASNLTKLLRLASEAGEFAGRTLREFAGALEEAVAGLEEEGESPLADENFNAVRVLTVHKAKGLEFPVIFLPNLSAAVSGSRQSPSCLWEEASRRVGFRLRQAGVATPQMLLLEQEKKLREKEEEVRILYVAMTRARHKLFLLSNEHKAPQGSLSGLIQKAGTFRAARVHRISVQELGKPKSGRQAKEKTDSSQAGPQRRVEPALPDRSRVPQAGWRRLALDWKAREKRWAAVQEAPCFLSPTALSEKSLRVPQAGRTGTGSGLLVGQLCHAVLEGWDFGSSPAKLKDPILLKEKIHKALTQIERGRFGEPGLEKALGEEAEEILHRFFESEVYRRIAGSRILGREVPFLYPYGNQVVRGSMDLLYEWRGRYRVADYKTDRVPDPKGVLSRHSPTVVGSHRPAFEMRAWAGEYRQQRRMYLEAVRRGTGWKDWKFEVIFLRLGKSVIL